MKWYEFTSAVLRMNNCRVSYKKSYGTEGQPFYRDVGVVGKLADTAISALQIQDLFGSMNNKTWIVLQSNLRR